MFISKLSTTPSFFSTYCLLEVRFTISARISALTSFSIRISSVVSFPSAKLYVPITLTIYLLDKLVFKTISFLPDFTSFSEILLLFSSNKIIFEDFNAPSLSTTSNLAVNVFFVTSSLKSIFEIAGLSFKIVTLITLSLVTWNFFPFDNITSSNSIFVFPGWSTPSTFTTYC